MEKKKLWSWTVGMLVAAFVLGLVKNVFREVYLFSELYAVAVPLLLIAAGIGGYFVYKDSVTIPGKLIWGVIGILLVLTFQRLELVSYGLLVSKQPALQTVAALLSTAGYVCVLLSLLEEKFRKLYCVGFGALALSAVCGGLGIDTAMVCLIYAAFVVIVRNLLPGYNPVFRTLSVILTVLNFSSMGLLAAVCWILLAYILVPAEKNRKISFSFAKFTAVLCALAVATTLLSFVEGEPMAAVEYRDRQIEDIEEKIENNKERILKLQEDIVTCQEKLATKDEELQKANAELTKANTALTTAKTNLNKAESNLDRECRRDSYSYWYCDSDCRTLHNMVSTKSKVVKAAQVRYNACENDVEDIKYEISSLQKKIKSDEKEIRQTEEQNENLKKERSRQNSLLWAERLSLAFNILTVLLNVVSLVLLAVCFWKGKHGNLALAACGAMILGALLPILPGRSAWYGTEMYGFAYMNKITLGICLSKIAIAALLAVMFVKKEGKQARYRVLAIILAVPLLILASGVILVEEISAVAVHMLLYSVTMICASLVLVPTVFTEYNSIAKHLFFTFISAGIWQFIWIYHVTKNLNCVNSVESRKPGAELLLSMFLPFYYSYWILKTAESVEAYAAENGKQCKLDVICFVFAFICPLVSTILLQNKINLIVEKPE